MSIRGKLARLRARLAASRGASNEAPSGRDGFGGDATTTDVALAIEPTVQLRVAESLWDDVLAHVTDFTEGEQAGFLVCRSAGSVTGETLLAREFHPVPDSEIIGRETEEAGGFGLAWTAAFNASMIERAAALEAGLVLIHSHGRADPVRLSRPDRRNANALLPTMSRLLNGRTCATVVIGDSVSDGLTFSNGNPGPPFSRVSVVGGFTTWWPADAATRDQPLESRHDRQARAIGAHRQQWLGQARIAVVGASGGGSHVIQQSAHAGIGSLMPIDGDVTEDVNLGRMVGSQPADVAEKRFKVDVMDRLINSIDDSTDCVAVRADFPHRSALSVMASADVVVCCVDSFRVRAEVSDWARRHLIPLVDIGLVIETDNGVLKLAHGQVVVTTPDSACARCTPLASDAVLAAEPPPGYDRNDDGGDAQVVSMNGTLAAEAVNCVLDLLTGYSGGRRGPGWWGYDGAAGTLTFSKLPTHRPNCPGCAQLGLGDPTF
jgi:hypothetical protein